MDGTFKIVPEQFLQLYTLHGYYMGKLFPFIYALLPNKSQFIYEKFWRMLKSAALKSKMNFEPKEVFCDFETSAINAVHCIFPKSVVKGCFFHYTQSIWRKVSKRHFLCCLISIGILLLYLFYLFIIFSSLIFLFIGSSSFISYPVQNRSRSEKMDPKNGSFAFGAT